MSIERYHNLIQAGLLPDLDPCKNPDHLDEWARLGFHVAFKLCRMVQAWRYRVRDSHQASKEDGSPFTRLELEMEKIAREALHKFYPSALFVGEESGGVAGSEAYLFVIDPIDGTRSFLSGFDTYSITLSILKDASPIMSLVCVPASGDIFFRLGKEKSRVLQLPGQGSPLHMCELPLLSHSDHRPILVNLHPSRDAHAIREKLYWLWQKETISLLRSVSGSPALFMVEAAKTGSYYVNTWQGAPTKPYDLIPALSIVEGAGSRALKPKYQPVDYWEHQGHFVVGPEGKGMDLLLSVIEEVSNEKDF